MSRRMFRRPQPGEAGLPNPARKGEVAIRVGEAFPRADRPQRRRLQGGDGVLADGQVRHPEHDDVAVAPRLAGDPLHQVVGVLGFLARQQLSGAVGMAAAARVGIHHGEALRGPPGRVRGLPAGQGREASPVPAGAARGIAPRTSTSCPAASADCPCRRDGCSG